MTWLKSKDCEMLRLWARKNRVPMLASGQDGKIHWANEAFEELIGYSEYELTIGANGKGIKWTEISVNDQNLEADVRMTQDLIDGKRDDYSVRKQYQPKNAKPVWVEVHVMRWPTGGDVDCFLVTVIPLKDASQDAAEMATETLRETRAEIAALKALVAQAITKKITDTEIMAGAIARTINKYPRAAGLVCIVMLVMVLGAQLVQAVEATKRMMGMQVDTVKIKDQ